MPSHVPFMVEPMPTMLMEEGELPICHLETIPHTRTQTARVTVMGQATPALKGGSPTHDTIPSPPMADRGDHISQTERGIVISRIISPWTGGGICCELGGRLDLQSSRHHKPFQNQRMYHWWVILLTERLLIFSNLKVKVCLYSQLITQ